MKTLKYYLQEASLLDIEGTIEVGNKYNENIKNFSNLLKSKSLDKFNECTRNFISILDTNKQIKNGDCVARISYIPVCLGNSYEHYIIYIGYRGKQKQIIIEFSPHSNSVFLEYKYAQISKPYCSENTYYGIVPKYLQLAINDLF